jgi:hypothetical protein
MLLHHGHDARVRKLVRINRRKRGHGVLSRRPRRKMEHEPVFTVRIVGDLNPEIPIISMHAENVDDPRALSVADATAIELRGDDVRPARRWIAER